MHYIFCRGRECHTKTRKVSATLKFSLLHNYWMLLYNLQPHQPKEFFFITRDFAVKIFFAKIFCKFFLQLNLKKYIQ